MNILIFSWRGPGHPHAGGAEQATQEYAKGWVKLGHNVTLFTSYYSGAKKQEIIDGVKIKRSGSQIFGVHIAAFQWFIFDKHEKFDIVIDQFHGIPFFTPIYVREKKLAFIHEVTKEVWDLNPWNWPFNLIPAIIGKIFEPYLFKIFYRNIPFMTGANSTKQDLIFWGIPKKNITIIPYGVNLPRIRSFQKEDKKTLIFLGALSRDKGIEDIIKIFSKLNNSNHDFQFWIVGKCEKHYLNKLKKQIDRLGITNKIKFWGFVTEEQKFKLLGKAHLLIDPSVREGWGLVVIEAAAVETPTVGYNVAGLKDSIVDGKTGLLCNPDPDSCSEAVLSLIKNNGKYELFRKNCSEWSKKFNWEKSSEKGLQLIEKLVSN